MRIALTLVLLAACRPKTEAPIADATPEVATVLPDANDLPIYPSFADKTSGLRGFDDVKGTAIVDFVDGRCTIAPDDSAKCIWFAGSTPLEQEDGAEQLVWKDGAIGGTAPVAAPSFHWGRAFANGRVVFVDREGNLFEIQKGHAVNTKRQFLLRHGSTTFVDGWVLWKDTSGEGDARIMALNLANAGASPIAIGKTKRPTGTRRYGSCATNDRYVNMDPNLVVLSKGKWTMFPLEEGRRIVCAGDHAILSDEPMRCDPSGCRKHAYTGIGPDAGGVVEISPFGRTIEHHESLGADDVRFELDHYDAVTIDVIPNGETYHRVPLTEDGILEPHETSLHVVAGRALVLGRRKSNNRWVLLSIDRSGAVKPIVAAQ